MPDKVSTIIAVLRSGIGETSFATRGCILPASWCHLHWKGTVRASTDNLSRPRPILLA